MDSEKKRITIVFVILALVGAIILFRLYLLQVVNYSYYANKSAKQHSFSRVLIPERGEIFFQDKDGKLHLAATTKNGYLLYVNPKKMNADNVDFREVYSSLNRVFKERGRELSWDEFIALAEKKNDPFEILARRIDDDLAKKIEELSIPGAGLSPESWRYYPAGNKASQILGFVGYQGDDLVGRYGVEETYEDVLKGKSGYFEGEGIIGSFLSYGRKIFFPPSKGNDLVLTIEPTVQAFLEKKLEDLLDKYKGETAGGIVLDPNTGKILAMSSKPDFNPNQYYEIKNFERFKNPIIQNLYEFGSVVKPLTIAAALDAGAVSRDTTYYDAGFVKIGSYTIKNYDERGRGKTDIQGILNESLNTGAVFVQRKLGREKFYQYFKNYGLGEKTGVGLEYDREGDLDNLKRGGEVEYATASFGQGVAFSPLAMARALSVLANGGYLIQPYVVERIQKEGLPDKYLAPKKPSEENRVLKKSTSEEISKILTNVADKALLLGKIKLEHYTMAAKTGTAQIPKKDGKGYSNEFLHSFFGYAPSFDPKFLVFLYIEKPQGVRYASASLGWPYSEIINFLLNYYEVPPDR